MLILKQANKSRPGGHWDADDYDVFDADKNIGRIMWTHAAPSDRQWFFSVIALQQENRLYLGVCTSLELRL